MTPERAQLLRAAAASAADALRVQGAAGLRGWSASDLTGCSEALQRIEQLIAGTAGVPRPMQPRDAIASSNVPRPSVPPPSPAPTRHPETPAPVAAQTTAAPTARVAAHPTAAPPKPVSAHPTAAPPAPDPSDRPWLDPPSRAGSGPVRFDLSSLLATGPDGLQKVRDALGDCRRCGLCERRTNIVFGVGNPSARLMFVGEGPGADEDASGEPFVGRAGELLNRMIGAMGLRRDEVYIANVVKCRPPDNRDPAPSEVVSCMPFLRAQIASVSPEVIVTLGRSALAALSGKPVTMRASRGRWLDLDGIAVMPTYHPAYILRLRDEELLAARRDAWTDLQAVMAKLGLRAPGRAQ